MKRTTWPLGLLVATAAAALAPPASAQPVFRCGDSYSERPCPGGTEVPAADPRSPAQQAQARAAIARDLKAAQALETARLKEEARARERAQALSMPLPELSPYEGDEPRHLARVRAPLKAVAPFKPGAKGRGKEPGHRKAKGTRSESKQAAKAAPRLRTSAR